jgi:hypothetical protein
VRRTESAPLRTDLGRQCDHRYKTKP